jgi:hypothetical protein
VPLPKKTKLNYRFHNPNTAEATAEALLAVFLQADQGKVERAIREAGAKAENPANVHSNEKDCAHF